MQINLFDSEEVAGVATEVMKRKSKEFDEQEKKIIEAVFAHSKGYF